jgi:hypothetical protein
MICPSCNKSASSLLRSAFSFRGVSRSKSIQGNLMCQHCGTLLRVAGYRKRFLLFYIPMIALLAVFVGSYRQLSAIFGTGVGLVQGVLMLVIFTAFTYSIWRNTHVEKVDADANSTTNSST